MRGSDSPSDTKVVVKGSLVASTSGETLDFPFKVGNAQVGS